MRAYLDLLEEIYNDGYKKAPAREGMPPTVELNSVSMKFDIYNDGFPILTTKKMSLKLAAAELHWFLSGSTNVKDLWTYNCHFWDSDAFKLFNRLYGQDIKLSFGEWKEKVLAGDTLGVYTYGDCGKIYGKQWRNFESDGRVCDQIKYLQDGIKNYPTSRYLMVSAWNPADFLTTSIEATLPACHCMFQVFVREERFLDLQLIQRSADMFLGVPYNLTSYGLLMAILADMNGLKPGVLTWVGGSAHIYENHFAQVEKILQRTPGRRPELIIKNHHKNAWEYLPEDFEFDSYEPQSTIKAELSVGV